MSGAGSTATGTIPAAGGSNTESGAAAETLTTSAGSFVGVSAFAVVVAVFAFVL